MATMSDAIPAERDRQESGRGGTFAVLAGWLRLGLLLPLLPAEILLLTLRFDAGRLAEQGGAWAWLLVYSSRLLKVFLAAVAATLLFGGVRLWREGRQIARERWPASPWWLYLTAHGAAVLAFAALTAGLFEGDLLAAHPGLWTGAWFALGLATFLLWLAALVAPSLWPRLARAAAWPVLGGCVLGLVALGLGMPTQRLWVPLGQATFAVVGWLLALTGVAVVSDPRDLTIGTATFGVQIAPDCSGYEGIGLILVFLGAYV